MMKAFQAYCFRKGRVLPFFCADFGYAYEEGALFLRGAEGVKKTRGTREKEGPPVT